MYSPTDTITAIATPPGHGGIGVVRISGPEAARVASRVLDRKTPLTPRRATLARLVRRGKTVANTGTGDGALDRVVVTYFPAPASYTGEHVVEIGAHGSPVLLREILDVLTASGARLAEPGEFSLRAFLNGRMDLVQAEAVRDLIDAVTPLQARAAFDQLEGTLTKRIGRLDARLLDLAARLEANLDFPDEGYHFVEQADVAEEIRGIACDVARLLGQAARGRVIRDGRLVAIAGKPNVGKSSLFNELAGSARAIVTPHPGTTRDLLTEVVDIGGAPITLVDTAGLRTSDDPIETEGILRAQGAIGTAAAALVVLDRSRPLDADDEVVLNETRGGDRLIVINKIDLPPCWDSEALGEDTGPSVPVSVVSGAGLAEFRQRLAEIVCGGSALSDLPAVTNLRHIRLLERVHASLERGRAAAEQAASEEFVLADLQEAREALEEITGRRTPDDVLRHIFERFCVGK